MIFKKKILEFGAWGFMRVYDVLGSGPLVKGWLVLEAVFFRVSVEQ